MDDDEIDSSAVFVQRTTARLVQARRFQQAADLFVPTARKAVDLSTQIEQRQQLLEDRLRRLEDGQRWSSFTNWPASTNHPVAR